MQDKKRFKFTIIFPTIPHKKIIKYFINQVIQLVWPIIKVNFSKITTDWRDLAYASLKHVIQSLHEYRKYEIQMYNLM